MSPGLFLNYSSGVTLTQKGKMDETNQPIVPRAVGVFFLNFWIGPKKKSQRRKQRHTTNGNFQDLQG